MLYGLQPYCIVGSFWKLLFDRYVCIYLFFVPATDEDVAMREAIRIVFDKSQHRTADGISQGRGNMSLTNCIYNTKIKT